MGYVQGRRYSTVSPRGLMIGGRQIGRSRDFRGQSLGGISAFFLSDDLPRCSIWLWALLTQRPDS